VRLHTARSRNDQVAVDFRLFVKMTEKLSNAKALLKKEAENFDWENLD
jgi:argininosuccinate lyase